MSRKSKHRGIRRNYPLSVKIYSAKNQWYYFTKPALKLQVMRLTNKALAWFNKTLMGLIKK